MKIVFVLSRLGTGGAPIQVVTLAREMRRRGHRAVLVTGPHDPRQDGDMSYLLEPGDDVRWIPHMTRSLYPWKDALALWRLWRVIRAVRPSIVHTHTAKAGLLGRLAAHLAGVPVVVHTFHGNVFNGYFPRLLAWFVKRIERCLAGISDGICVLSNQQAIEIAEGLQEAARSKIRVVPLGLELQPFFRLEKSLPPDDCFVIGWLGRFVPIKNLELLISVIDATLRRTDRVRFLIAGDGPQRRIIQSAVERFGSSRVRWDGWIRNVAPFISGCHALVQTSRNEGTPISLIQGMAAARPFLSTAAGGVVDMVAGSPSAASGGVRWFANGALVEPDPNAFASAICDLAQSPGKVRSMGREALKFALANYGLDTLLQNLNNLYGELLETESPLSKAPLRSGALPMPETR